VKETVPSATSGSSDVRARQLAIAEWLVSLSWNSEPFDALPYDEQQQFHRQLGEFLSDHGVPPSWQDAAVWDKTLRTLMTKLRKKGMWKRSLQICEMGQFEEGRLVARRPDSALLSALGAVAHCIRRCPRCKKVFAASGKRVYCSKECSDKARMERFRAKHVRAILPSKGHTA
jgi:hypothetical protein